MRKQAGKQTGKQTKKAAAAVAAASAAATASVAGDVCEPKPNGATKPNKSKKKRRGVATLAAAAPLVDTADGTQDGTATAGADTGVSGASPTKRTRSGRENKNKRNTKTNSGRISSGIGTSMSDGVTGSDKGGRNDEASLVVNGGEQSVSSRPVLIKSEIFHADTFVHVKSEIKHAEYLEKLKQDQLRYKQEQEQNQQLQQQQVQLEPHRSEYESAELPLNHHQQHLHQHEQQQHQQPLYTYQDHGETLLEGVPVSAAQLGSSLVHNIQSSLPEGASPSQRPGSVPDPEHGRSPLPPQQLPAHHHQQQLSQQDQQYPPLSLASQQQQYQHYQHHDNFPQEHHHHQQENLHHLQQHHQDIMHTAALDNDHKESPPPLLMPETSYVSTTSHPILMSGSITTHMVQNVGPGEAGELVYTHQPQQDHHHDHHMNSHHQQLLYEAAIHQQRNDGNIPDLHLQNQLQPPLAHSRGESSMLHQGLGNPHGRLSTIHIPASSLAGLSGHQESGDLQGMDSASPGHNQMPSLDHQQMAQQLAEMAHTNNQTFTMLTNVSSLSGAPSPAMGNKREKENMLYSPIPQEFMQHYIRQNMENNNDSDNNNHIHHHHNGEGGGGGGGGDIKGEQDKDLKDTPNRKRMKIADKEIKEEDQGKD